MGFPYNLVIEYKLIQKHTDIVDVVTTNTPQILDSGMRTYVGMSTYMLVDSSIRK